MDSSGSTPQGLLLSHPCLFAASAVRQPHMPFPAIHRWLIPLAVLAPMLFVGCAEGVFSGIGAYTPWVQSQWAEEERYVQSLYGRRKQLENLAAAAPRMQPAEQQRVSQDLAKLYNDDPITLLRIEVVKALVPFRTQIASDTLRAALKDDSTDVRIAACQAWAQRQDPQGVAVLQEALGSDTEIDVRLAATRALGTFRTPDAAAALSIALNDSDPAMQYRAMESLRSSTGQNLGGNIVAWRDYLRMASMSRNPSGPIQPASGIR